jgi:hypothetical protein
LARLARYVDSESGIAVEEAALKTWDEAVRKTPVQTGRARAGWHLSSRAGRDRPPVYEDVSGNDPRYRPERPRVSGGERELHLYNNVEYILFLEFGSSRQAPQGILRSALMRRRRELADAAGRIVGRCWGPGGG